MEHELENKPIKAIEVVGTDTLILNAENLLPKGYTTYTWNDEPLEVVRGQDLLVKRTDRIKEITDDQNLVGYKRGDVMLSPEEYKSKPQNYDNDDSEDHVLKCIVNRRELAGFVALYEKSPDRLLTYEIVGEVQNTKSNFIHNMFTHSKCCTDIANVYSVNVNQISIHEFMVAEVEYGDSAHFYRENDGHLRFAKINNSYAFRDKAPYRKQEPETFVSLKAAQAREQEIRDIVSKDIADIVLPKDSTTITHRKAIISRLQVMKRLKTKKAMIENLDVLIESLK